MKSSSSSSSVQQALPYWRLSGFYFFYFAVLGALVPFWSLYLQAEGYDSREIGWLSAVLMGTRIVAPNLWGWLGDRSGKRLKIVCWGAGFAALFFVGVILCGFAEQRQFVFLLLSVFLYSFFWNAILSQFEVITLNHLGDRPQRYSQIRLWGSIGFIVAVSLLGWIFDFISVQYLPWFLLFFLTLMWLCSLLLHEAPSSCSVSRWSGFGRIVCRTPVLCFMLSAFLLQLSFGPYYTFFSVYLEGLGYSTLVIGLFWSLGVAAEVIIFMVMHRLLPVLGVRNLLLLSVGLACIRWILVGSLADSAAVLVFTQCLHAFSFGTAHAAAIEFVRRYFKASSSQADYQGQGQSLYSSLSWGCGGALGALLSGYLWERGAENLFFYAAAVTALAFVAVLLGLKKNDPLLARSS